MATNTNNTGIAQNPAFKMRGTIVQRLLGMSIADDAKPILVPLFFSLRLWASVCLALYLSYQLQLENPMWAGLTAAIICMPDVGSSLRKGWFRIIGTLIGATMSLVLAAAFPQDRVMFILGLALWCAFASFMSSLLRNFASYSAALSGYTVAIIGGDALANYAAIDPNTVFQLVTERTSEVCLGIVCAGFIRLVTDIGRSRDILGATLGSVTSEIACGFLHSIETAGRDHTDIQEKRHALLKKVIDLDPLIDRTIGESSRLRDNSPILQRAVDGLFQALLSWRTVTLLLSRLSASEAEKQVSTVLHALAPDLAMMRKNFNMPLLSSNAAALQEKVTAAAARLSTLSCNSAPERLLLDATAEFLCGLSYVLDGIFLVQNGQLLKPEHGYRRARVADYLPAVVNAARAFIVVVLVSAFWVITAWPGGVGAIMIATISVVLLGPNQERAYAMSMLSLYGILAALVLALFARTMVFPALPANFPALAIGMGLFLVPLGILSVSLPNQAIGLTIGRMPIVFVVLVNPQNSMVYDNLSFFNMALSLVAGATSAGVFFRILAPLTPAYRTRQLLDLSRSDLYRLASGRIYDRWNQHLFGRLVAMPNQASPLQRAQLLAILAAGNDIRQLVRLTQWIGKRKALDPAIELLVRGESRRAAAMMRDIDLQIQSHDYDPSMRQTILRVRGCLIRLWETLDEHGEFFDQGARG